MKAYLSKYCVGCGLCGSMGKAALVRDERGYLHPQTGDEAWLKQICPAGGAQTCQMEPQSVWGKIVGVYTAWACEPGVRRAASSGGVLTALAVYLLQNSLVDAVVHVGADEQAPSATRVFLSATPQQVMQRCGSRYAISHPLSALAGLDCSKRYALVGRPCDIAALRNLMRQDPGWEQTIPYTLSFFCAGMPSVPAQERLLAELGCDKEHCISLQYRGNGWPGRTVAVDDQGHTHSMDYNSSWGHILGRDLMDMCRYCLDGIGELADVSAGDDWYRLPDGTPDFSEHEGRNILFARTERGNNLIRRATRDGALHLEPCPDYAVGLPLIQKYQHERRATMAAKLLALRLLGKPAPRYRPAAYLPYARHVPRQTHLQVFKGMIKRGLKGKL